MSKKTYNEDVLDEFNNKFNTQHTEDIEDRPQQRSLGKVDFGGNVSMKSDDMLGYIDLPFDSLPSKGMFYPDDMSIAIRAASVREIRDFSIIDSNNPKDVADRTNMLISGCVRVMKGNMPLSYKEILECDKLMVLLHVRALTFESGLSSIKIPVSKGNCTNVGCDFEGEIPLDFSMVELKEFKSDSVLMRYYDRDMKCFNVKTKNYGEFQIKMPTIGTSEYVLNWIYVNQNKKWDKAIIPLLTYFVDYKQRPDLFRKAVEAESWGIKKFELIHRLVEQMTESIGIAENFKAVCPECGGDMKIPFQIVGGLKSLFVESVHDILDELV